MSQMNVNQKLLKESLEAILKALPCKEYVNYFEFLLIAKQLNLRFESADSLIKLKLYFEKEGHHIKKQMLMAMITPVGYEVISNRKNYIVKIETQNFFRKKNIKPIVTKQVDSLLQKITSLKSYLEQFHGDTIAEWFQLFDIQNTGFLKLYELKWAFNIYLNSLLTDSQIRLIYNILQKNNNGINLMGFSELFDNDLMKSRLEEYFDEVPKKQKQRLSTQIHIKQCPLTVIPMTTTAYQNRNSHQIKRRSSMNLKYYRPKNNTKKKLSIQKQTVDHSNFSKSFQMDLCSFNKFVESKDKDITKNKSDKNRLIHFEFMNKQQRSLPLSSYVKKRRNTKASELRKQFINQFVLSREKKLEPSRFKISEFNKLDSGIFGKSFFLKY